MINSLEKMSESNSLSNSKWYILKVVTGQEKRLKSFIETEVSKGELQGRDIKILIPSEKVYEVKNGKKKIKEKQFFPGYMVLNVDLEDGQAAHVISKIPGVLGFLNSRGWGISKKPVSLRKSEITKIIGTVEEKSENIEKLEKSFVQGESVKVIDGPFNGFVGNVQNIYEDRKKIEVMVKILGRNTPIELNYIQVEKLE